LRVFSKSWLF